MRNKIEFKVFGMRRSGNHAIIHWMASHFDKPCWMVNDISDFGRPSVTDDYTNASELECFHDNEGISELWEKEKDVLFQTYEDYDLSDLDWYGNEQVVGKSDREVIVLIVRDPYNLMASRFARRMPFVVPVNRIAVERWNQHVRDALGETDYLRDPWKGEMIAQKNRRVVVVNYNKWFSQPMYRRELELEMGLPGECDDSMERVVMAGSSFSDRGRDGSASKMSINKRWKIYESDPGFIGLFNRRTVELATMMGFKYPWGKVQ